MNVRLGHPVTMHVDDAPTHAIVTAVNGATDDDGVDVELTAFPAGAGLRHFSGVHLHDTGDAAAECDHNLVAWPTDDDDPVDVEQLGQDDAADDEPPAAPVQAKQTAAAARRNPAKKTARARVR